MDAIFPQKEELLYDLFKTKLFTNEFEYLHMSEKITKQESNKEKNELKEIPEYFALSKIKGLMTSKLSPEIIKELNQKIFLDKNFQKVESEINDQVFLGKKRKKKDKTAFNDEDKMIYEERKKMVIHLENIINIVVVI